MPLDKIGEFGLIKRFKKMIRNDSSVIQGSGDDCAVLSFDKKLYQLFSCDMIVEGVDFRLNDRPGLIGRKAVAVCLSDIAACCGWPTSCLVSLGIPRGAKVSFLEKVFRGMLALAREFNFNIVGGDISRSDKLVIDVSMLGLVEKESLALRSNAKERDIIFVTGRLGGSIKGRHFEFTPRIKEARYLAKRYKINSMIDISDGLAQDLGHILEASCVGAVVFSGLIPLSRQAEGLNDALYSGEDFELLFTLPRQEALKLISQKVQRFYPIGEILNKKSGFSIIDAKGRQKALAPKGYKHF